MYIIRGLHSEIYNVNVSSPLPMDFIIKNNPPQTIMHPLNEHEALETEKRGESSERCMSSYLFLIPKEPLTIN